MRVLSASALGSLSTAALLLPLALPATANAAEQDSATDARTAKSRPVDARTSPEEPAAPHSADGSSGRATRDGASAGSTQSLRLSPARGSDRVGQGDQVAGGVRKLAPRTVEPFSLLGVIWEDVDRELGGEVQVRTRSVRTGAWSGWHELTEHRGRAAEAQAAGEQRRAAGKVRGATAPLWVGASDGVQLRAEAVSGKTAKSGTLPEGMRLELVRPGESTAEPEGGERRGTPEGATLPALDQARTRDAAEERGRGRSDAYDPQGEHVAPRPSIVTRDGWGADPELKEPGSAYTDTVKMAFVHHSAGSNDYECSQAPEVIRGIYRYHVRSSGWRDIGYNFLVDKCGKVYEGRAGGVTEPVRGAHTLGFNENSMGIAVLGSYGKTPPSEKAQRAVAELTGWKLGLYGVDAAGTVNMTGDDGQQRMDSISGHRDGFNTECPGEQLYGRLDEIRATAARLQGR